MGVDTCSLCTMMTPRISCAPQPSPSRHRRSKSKSTGSQGRVERSGREGFTYPFYTDKSLLFRIAMSVGYCRELWMAVLILRTLTRGCWLQEG
ncbi:hypothetical protein ACQJBY_051893 [Aegilops geniculata]